jgi:hypothetical protein
MTKESHSKELCLKKENCHICSKGGILWRFAVVMSILPIA